MPPMPEPNAPSTRPPLGLAALAPLQQRPFALLWVTWLTANISLWMNDVAAAWLMTTLTTSPAWVALVQTAATLPVLLLGLPSGVLADAFERRRLLLFTQVWAALVALTLVLVVKLDALTPALLLALVFANGIGLALRWPVYAALMPHLVPRAQLPAALALNGVSMNISRIVGPLVAGLIIASLGSEWVFVLNAMLAVGCAALIWRWRSPPRAEPLQREPFWSALLVGVRFVAQSARLRLAYLQVGLFFFHSAALIGLLPLLALRYEGASASTFAWLLAAMGSGAILSALWMPRLRQGHSRAFMVWAGMVLQALTMLVVTWAPWFWAALLAMFVAGMAWIAVANTLNVAAQLGMPDWVRARAISVYQMALMGGAALGAAAWGKLAHWVGVPLSVSLAALSALCLASLSLRWSQRSRLLEDPGLEDEGREAEPPLQ